jgi:hypothetical protein
MKFLLQIFTAVLLMTSVSGFANNTGLNETTETEKKVIVKTEKKSEQLAIYECSVTSSGTATTSDGTVVNLTLTVTGPCDSSIAQMMRDEIAKVRAEMAQI